MKRDNLQCCRPTVMITSLQIPRHHRSLASRNHFPSRPIAETWLGYSLYVALSVLSYLDKQIQSRGQMHHMSSPEGASCGLPSVAAAATRLIDCSVLKSYQHVVLRSRQRKTRTADTANNCRISSEQLVLCIRHQSLPVTR